MTRRSSKRVVAGLMSVGVCLAAAACASSEDASSDGKKVQIAYLQASSANTWLQAADGPIQKIAKAKGADVTSFDAQFKPGEQSKQIQDIIATDKYDGIIIASVDGAGVIPDLEQAIDAGIEVVVLNQIIGTDLSTADPQVKGAAASVLVPPRSTGERLGKITLEACASTSPCRVVYFYGLKGSPGDTAIREGFDSTVKAGDVKVVADAEGKFLGPDESLKAMKDILQTGKKFDVVVGPDQSIQGALLALNDAGIKNIKAIGTGGSEPAIAGIKDKTWFGGVMGLPQTEGELAINAVLDAIDGKPDAGGVDPADTFPGGVLVTQGNVDKYTAQWAG